MTRIIEVEEGPDGEIPPISLRSGEPTRIVLIRSKVIRVRITGFLFESGKCFLLPTAMNGIRKLVEVYEQNPKTAPLVTGHTDRLGAQEDNDRLSLERARAVSAYLTDDVSSWLEFYDEAVPDGKRWGHTEDAGMLAAVGFEDDVVGFQQAMDLEDDGICGPQTRAKLVGQYMALDGTSLPPGASLITFGCGEHFPVVETDDGVDEPKNRRVELFLFRGAVDPAPAGNVAAKGSSEYPTWVSRARRTIDVETEPSMTTVRIQLFDPNCRPLSAVRYRVRLGDEAFTGLAKDGVATFETKSRAERCLVEWNSGEPPEGVEFEHQLEVFVDVAAADPLEQAKRRLCNLGYPLDMSMSLDQQPAVVRRFQHDARGRYDLEVTGEPDRRTLEAITDAHDRCDPVAASTETAEAPHEDDHLDDLDHVAGEEPSA